MARRTAFCTLVRLTPARAAISAMVRSHWPLSLTSSAMILSAASSAVVNEPASCGGIGPDAASRLRRDFWRDLGFPWWKDRGPRNTLSGIRRRNTSPTHMDAFGEVLSITVRHRAVPEPRYYLIVPPQVGQANLPRKGAGSTSDLDRQRTFQLSVQSCS
ncbi:exported hypothetical protein [Hyphomicrobiales bacterium]|nr:exported hypothetical protein [Hyphomicrobiales bacterium]